MEAQTHPSPGVLARAENSGLKRIIRLREVMAQTGLGRSSIYDRAAKGTFPRPIAIGENSVGWDQDAVQLWIRQRIEAATGKLASAEAA